MEIIKLSLSNFEEEVLNSEKTVLIDFYADWCGPCKMMAPVIEELAEENQEKVKVCKVNVDDEQELASRYGIMSIPTLIFFKNGEVSDTVIGLTSKSDIISRI